MIISAKVNPARHEHGALSQLLGLSKVSVARTWRVSSGAAIAGEESTLKLTCGQVTAARLPRLVVQVSSLESYDRAQESVSFRRALTIHNAVKGEERAIKFGPITAAGGHLLSVTIDGAHVMGSPLQLVIHPAAPDAAHCDLRPLRKPGRACGGPACEPIVFAATLRDRWWNVNTLAQAQAAMAAGRLAASVRKRPSTPPEAARIGVVPGASAGPPVSPTAVGTAGVADRVGGHVEVRFGVSVLEGLITVTVTAAVAAAYEVALFLDGRPFKAPVAVHVHPSRTRRVESNFGEPMGGRRRHRVAYGFEMASLRIWGTLDGLCLSLTRWPAPRMDRSCSCGLHHPWS